MLKRQIGDLLHNSGYHNDLEFWSAFSGITSNKPNDHQVHKLSTLGFTGTPKEQLRKWADNRASTLVNGTTMDCLQAIFQNKTFLSTLMTTGL